ncbi:SH3 domain-containing protein [Bacillus sp. 1P06AnD]|uniref:SH3 domain-containing protein n=1 Tax=Bacillus sp. 1P06AnD TaxID=3132208 RepID=UPI0039A2D3F4
MKEKLLKVLLSSILLVGLYTPFATNSVEAKAASVQEGVVDIVNGHLAVRSQPSGNASSIGTLKRSQKVNVYSQKNGWAHIQYGSKKGYISLKYVRFYRTTSAGSVKKITDRAISTQRKTWEKAYTKNELYTIMSPAFTQAYIDGNFKTHYMKSGIRNGQQLYSIIPTEIWGYGISTFDWYGKYGKKPTYSFYVKNNAEYLIVSQYQQNEESGNNTMTLSLIKQPKSNWKVFGINRIYH